MTRRIVLALTALAVIGVGTGVATASPAVPSHQICILLYHQNDPNPQYICVNY
jgi:hypothetical protein